MRSTQIAVVLNKDGTGGGESLPQRPLQPSLSLKVKIVPRDDDDDDDDDD
jgi:hypothetical protein